MAQKLCTQQTASLLSEKPGGFFDSLKRGARGRLFFQLSLLQLHRHMVGAVALKFAQVRVHPLHDLVVILLRNGRVIQIPQRQLLGQDLKNTLSS